MYADTERISLCSILLLNAAYLGENSSHTTWYTFLYYIPVPSSWCTSKVDMLTFLHLCVFYFNQNNDNYICVYIYMLFLIRNNLATATSTPPAARQCTCCFVSLSHPWNFLAILLNCLIDWCSMPTLVVFQLYHGDFLLKMYWNSRSLTLRHSS